MPLKNPTEVPKIPKARKKKAEAALVAIPEKKPDRLEYYCDALFIYDEFEKKQYAAFRIYTKAEFTTFDYDLSVNTLEKDDEHYFVLMGLIAKPNRVAYVQPAKKDIRFENLNGEFKINVVKQDGCINSAIYQFNYYTREIKLISTTQPEKKNNRFFCEFDIAKNDFSFDKLKN
ncbi:MAG: hypothetical protein K9J12_02760 [Melioribacteraceae bacterium]|nr:hypothetical protein [Melioribacteraceae bacterium]MCF8413889.1 hypothetical protein [Melioribacteraceae bacterium]